MALIVRYKLLIHKTTIILYSIINSFVLHVSVILIHISTLVLFGNHSGLNHEADSHCLEFFLFREILAYFRPVRSVPLVADSAGNGEKLVLYCR